MYTVYVFVICFKRKIHIYYTIIAFNTRKETAFNANEIDNTSVKYECLKYQLWGRP